MHHSDILQGKGGDRYWHVLQRCKAEGLVRKIGISLYDVSETVELVECYSPEVVQIPLNPLDQRFFAGGRDPEPFPKRHRNTCSFCLPSGNSSCSFRRTSFLSSPRAFFAVASFL